MRLWGFVRNGRITSCACLFRICTFFNRLAITNRSSRPIASEDGDEKRLHVHRKEDFPGFGPPWMLIQQTAKNRRASSNGYWETCKQSRNSSSAQGVRFICASSSSGCSLKTLKKLTTRPSKSFATSNGTTGFFARTLPAPKHGSQ